MSESERFQSVGQIYGGAIEELGYDAPDVFEAIAGAATDVTVVFVEETDREELWHQDYNDGWLRVGTFDSEAAAHDADHGFDESVIVHNYGNGQAELYATEAADE